MGDGAGGTLVIHPRGLSDITLDLDCDGSKIVPAQSLRFNEEKRRQIIYSQAPPGEGGEVVGEYGPLVPVSFSVAIKEDTRAAMIEAYNTFQAALLNKTGGTVEYKPDGVGAGVLSTFYHYVQSGPPTLAKVSGNRWDAEAKSDGKYTLFINLEFATHPAATSDPDSPATLAEMADTLENWVDDSPAQSNKVEISASNLKGELPALLRFLVQPAATQYLGRLIVSRRDSGECTLANVVTVYEAEDSANIYPSSAWTSVADSDRGDGNYLRCLPSTDGNGDAQGRRFTISNPGDHKGRFAVFGIGYDDAYSTGVWTHQVKVTCGNVTQTGEDDKQAEHLRVWGLIYAGEFELPPTPLSDSESGYGTGPYIDWYSSRASGSSEFRLDGIVLVYVSDSKRQPTALGVVCDDVDLSTDIAGVSNSEKLLVENYPDDYGQILELAHVVVSSDGDFKRVLATAPRGDFLTLDPTLDHRLYFVWERPSWETILDDDFESYKGSRWMPIAEFEDDESWSSATGFSQVADNLVEGSKAGKFQRDDAISTSLVSDLDLENEGRFTDGDFVCVMAKLVTSPDYGYIVFYTSGGNYYYNTPYSGVGVHFHHSKKSTWNTQGSPDWGDIALTQVYADDIGSVEYEFYLDCWRIEKADPDDADNPNATGSQWDFQPTGGAWTVTEDISSAGATLACLDIESGVEKSALIDETTPNDVRFRARVMAKRDAGYVGIVWRAGTDTLTEGTEDCYAAVLDIANDVVLVREYANGAITQHDNPALVSAVDTWYTVGVEAKGSTFRVYATATSDLTDDDDVFAAAYLLATVTDATLTTGKCGVMSISTLGRFDEAKLVSLQDKHIPADTLTLEGKAIWRTIAPFCE